jgi:ABC-type transport system involved in multi-copper enzyme maturation permease subunit
MMPIWLLARSFMRQNRWLMLAFVLWPFFFGTLLSLSEHPAANGVPESEVQEIALQEIFYGVAVVGFLASSAVHNEKRSRRITGVLSKAVSREQYLAGLLLASACFAGIYFFSVSASLLWLLKPSTALVASCAALFLHAVIASLWIASLSLLLSIVLHPLLAAAMAGAAAFAPFAAANPNDIWAPVAALTKAAGTMQHQLSWAALTAALIESAIFYALASSIFSRRDVAANIE